MQCVNSSSQEYSACINMFGKVVILYRKAVASSTYGDFHWGPWHRAKQSNLNEIVYRMNMLLEK